MFVPTRTHNPPDNTRLSSGRRRCSGYFSRSGSGSGTRTRRRNGSRKGVVTVAGVVVVGVGYESGIGSGSQRVVTAAVEAVLVAKGYYHQILHPYTKPARIL